MKSSQVHFLGSADVLFFFFSVKAKKAGGMKKGVQRLGVSAGGMRCEHNEGY